MRPELEAQVRRILYWGAMAPGGERAGSGDEASPWQYDARAHAYRDTRTGKFLSPTERSTLRAEVQSRYREKLAGHTRDLLDGETTASEWQTRMARTLKSAHTAQYAFGKGGIHAMDAGDRTAVKETLDSQYGYLHKFAQQIDDGDLSDAQIAARADLYATATTGSFHAGRAASFGELDLPQVPGDGQTQCVSNCACDLEFEETDEGVDVYWRLGEADHCDDCLALADEWSPYSVTL